MIIANEQAEYAALSAMLHDADCASIGVAELSLEDFTASETSSVFSAIVEQVSKGGATDIVALCVAFPDRIVEITNCMSVFGIPSQFSEYKSALHEARQRRDVYRLCDQAQKAAADWDNPAYMSILQGFSVETRFEGSQVKPIGGDAIEAVTALYEAKMGTRMGFGDIDSVLWGMKPGELIVLGARPGMGKSSFAMNVAVNVARYTGAVAVFSLEMGTEQLLQRAAMAMASVSKQDIVRGDEQSAERIVRAGQALSELPMYISDKSNLTVDKIRAYCYRASQKQPLRLIVVDYLQLLSSSKRRDNREQEVAEQSRALKILARDLECPVLLLSQLNRATDGMPQLKNLRESGAIEQDADVVLFISEGDEPTQATISIAKNRSGSTGIVTLRWDAKYCRFTSMDWTSDAKMAEPMEEQKTWKW